MPILIATFVSLGVLSILFWLGSEIITDLTLANFLFGLSIMCFLLSVGCGSITVLYGTWQWALS